jgi:diguanylate cyclase (GGDEF)-like protein
MNDKKPEIYSSPAVVENYDLLNQIGIWGELDSLNKRVGDLEELLTEAIELFSKHSIPELVTYVTTRMLDKFIPAWLAFVIQEQLDIPDVSIICYKNLQLVKPVISVSSLTPFKKFFSLSPASIRFDAFTHLMNNAAVSSQLEPLEPEILVPLIGSEQIYGFIVFGSKVLGKEYNDSDISYIDQVMQFASVSLQNNINYKSAIVDSKTRLYNNSFFLRRLEEEMSRQRRYKTVISLLMIDIDHFKNLNDTYGHLAGDAVLRRLAEIMNEDVRNEDVAARFGGEEFVIMLIGCIADEACNVAERLRKRVADEEVVFNKITLKITISIGVSHVTPEDTKNGTKLIEEADVALYNSKDQGRNRVTLFNHEN